MSDSAAGRTPDRWQDAVRAAATMAVAPAFLGGAVVRSLPGPVRDEWLHRLRQLLAPGTPVRRIPLHVADARLLGGLELAATLRAGRPVAQQGLLAECHGGVALLAMAERVAPGTVAQIGAVLDTGELVVERESLAMRTPCRFGVVALDEGLDQEEVAPAMSDRLALMVNLHGLGLGDLVADEVMPDAGAMAEARQTLSEVRTTEEDTSAVCATAQALGIGSLRPCLWAERVARITAALGGRDQVVESDLATAARLVLVPRATRLPPLPENPEEDAPVPEQEQQAQSEAPDEPSDGGDGSQDSTDKPLEERVLEAAKAALPANLLDQLDSAARRVSSRRAAGKAGMLQRARKRGRRVGVMPASRLDGDRLDLLATLRAAAPWQGIRRRESARPRMRAPALLIRREDFRITRFQQRSETTSIFVVDASGSSALHRLAEAKGAVERVLADCYVRRDQVALIAFRGQGAELLLPPTRSLVRAKRSLAGLPGGGGTPLSAAIIAAAQLADQVERAGGTPTVVLLTDGQANVARDGSHGRRKAFEDALAAAGILRASRIRALVIDISPRPHPNARQLAQDMGAHLFALPHGDSLAVSKVVLGAPAGG